MESKWLTVFQTIGSIAGLIVAIIGWAGIPEDLSKWTRFISHVKSKINHNTVRTGMVILGVAVVVACWLPWGRWLGTDSSPAMARELGSAAGDTALLQTQVAQLEKNLQAVTKERDTWQRKAEEMILEDKTHDFQQEAESDFYFAENRVSSDARNPNKPKAWYALMAAKEVLAERAEISVKSTAELEDWLLNVKLTREELDDEIYQASEQKVSPRFLQQIGDVQPFSEVKNFQNSFSDSHNAALNRLMRDIQHLEFKAEELNPPSLE